MSDTSKPARSSLVRAKLPRSSTLFVCRDCGLGAQRRREFKAAVKAAGRKRDVRVVACRCLDICPKRGTTTVLASSTGPARCAVIDDATDAAAALAELLDAGACAAVAE